MYYSESLERLRPEATMNANWDLFTDAGPLGNFLENQDIPH